MDKEIEERSVVSKKIVSAFDLDGDGIVDEQEVIKSKKIISAFDLDGDGIVDEEELMKAEEKLKQTQEQKQFLRAQNQIMQKMLYFIGGLLLLSVIATTIAMIIVVDMSKDTSAEGDKLVNRESGNTLQVENAAFEVDANGNIVPRQSQTDSNDASASAFNEDSIGEIGMQALATRRSYATRKLSSTMPPQYFKELDWLDIKSPNGLQTMALRVNSVTSSPSVNAKCGLILIIGTSEGKMYLDDTDIYYDDNLKKAFEAGGMQEFEGDSDVDDIGFVSGRRRLSGSISMLGFFNTVDSYEWPCTTVEKPSYPSTFSAKTTVYSKCNDDNNNCLVTLNGLDYLSYGVTKSVNKLTNDETNYLPVNRENFRDLNYDVMVDRLLFSIDRSHVLLSDKVNNVIRTYTVHDDGRVSHCKEVAVQKPVQLDVPNDYIFYYVGSDESTGQRHFRISYLDPNDDSEDAEYFHYDYFDAFDENYNSYVPQALVSADETVLEMSEVKIGDDRQVFENSRYYVSDEEWEKCQFIYEKVVQEGDYEFIQEKMKDYETYYSELNTTKEKIEFSKMKEYWVDWNTSYPQAADNDPNSFQEDDLEYLVDKFDDDNHNHTDLASWSTDIVEDMIINNMNITNNQSNRRKLFMISAGEKGGCDRLADGDCKSTFHMLVSLGLMSLDLDFEFGKNCLDIITLGDMCVSAICLAAGLKKGCYGSSSGKLAAKFSPLNLSPGIAAIINVIGKKLGYGVGQLPAMTIGKFKLVDSEGLEIITNDKGSKRKRKMKERGMKASSLVLNLGLLRFGIDYKKIKMDYYSWAWKTGSTKHWQYAQDYEAEGWTISLKYKKDILGSWKIAEKTNLVGSKEKYTDLGQCHGNENGYSNCVDTKNKLYFGK